MKNIIEYAFELYSGQKPYGIFVAKLIQNLENMNAAISDINDIFKIAGIPDFFKTSR